MIYIRLTAPTGEMFALLVNPFARLSWAERLANRGYELEIVKHEPNTDVTGVDTLFPIR